MSIFNRVVMTVSVLLFIALVAYVMILPPDAIYFAQQGLDNFRQWLASDQSFYVFPIIGGVLLLALLILLWLELRRPRRKTVRIGTKTGGDAQLGIQSVAQSLEYRIDELAGVRKVVSRIVSRGRDVDVYLDLDTSPSVNIPVLTDQIVDLAHDIVEGQLGIKIHGKVGINIKHEPYPRGTMPPLEPAGNKAVAMPPLATATAAATAAATGGTRRREAPRVIQPVEVPLEPEETAKASQEEARHGKDETDQEQESGKQGAATEDHSSAW